MRTTPVPNHELGEMLFCAFRYSLGRMTYQVQVCRRWLETYWSILPAHTQELIHEEINRALDRKRAGMDIDEAEWRLVLLLPVASEEARRTCSK